MVDVALVPGDEHPGVRGVVVLLVERYELLPREGGYDRRIPPRVVVVRIVREEEGLRQPLELVLRVGICALHLGVYDPGGGGGGGGSSDVPEKKGGEICGSRNREDLVHK